MCSGKEKNRIQNARLDTLACTVRFAAMSLRLVAFSVFCLFVSGVSAFAGPFDNYIGKYKGRGVERSNAVYYYQQTTKVSESSQTTTMTLPGVVTLREVLQFRSNGTVSGSGRAIGHPYTWRTTGTWKMDDNVLKTRTTTYYSNGDVSSSKVVQRFEEEKLVSNSSGQLSDGTLATTSFKGKLHEVQP